jgi:prevent-host-death family protein
MTMRRKRERVVAAADFKAKCLALLDEVAERHETVIVTKRGKPVARVVPIEEPVQSMLGSVRYQADIVEPLGEVWTAER